MTILDTFRFEGTLCVPTQNGTDKAYDMNDEVTGKDKKTTKTQIYSKAIMKIFAFLTKISEKEAEFGKIEIK